MKYYISIYLHRGFTNNRQHSLLGPMSWQPLFLLSTVASQWWMAPRVAQSSVSRGPMLRSWRRAAKASLFSWQPRDKASAPCHQLVLAKWVAGWGDRVGCGRVVGWVAITERGPLPRRLFRQLKEMSKITQPTSHDRQDKSDKKVLRFISAD